ncbi:M1 family metallopeptidase [Candidatus Saccharibacteria bacterium]|nr:M1 family metallopeptidase [Candidatus Saccharibacteria bacterium]
MEHLIKYFKPESYKLKLRINKETGLVQGGAVITGEKLGETLKFHAKNSLNLAFVTVNNTDKRYQIKREDDDTIEILDVRETGKITVTFRYSFQLSHNMQGAYISTYKYQTPDEDAPHTEKIVSTQFESHYARECFPCIDEPEAKATFDLTIIDTDVKDTIISNMPAKSERILEYQSVDPEQDPARGVELNTKVKRKIVEFETTPKMSTYLLVFSMGHFHKRSKLSKNGIRVTTYCPLNQNPNTLDFANDIAADSLDYYDQAFGVHYPLPKLDQVAIPDFEAGAMENWGLVTYREACLLAAPGESKTTKEYISTVIAHELSHQWFGNLVTMKWWDNLWLNESFANMMEYVCIDAIRPSYHIWEYFFTGECKLALMRDALPGVQAVQQEVKDPAEIATLFDGAIVYAKGAHLMFMLMREMGEKEFFKGLKAYFKKYQYQNTTGDDLWHSLGEFANFDVKDFMDAWISQPGFPVITDGEQQRFLLTGATDDEKWPIIKVRDDMSGHYIINLSADEFSEELARFDNLSLEQKIRLLIDRSMLAKTSLVSSATHLELLPKFKDEEDYAVWSSVLGIITDLKLFFPPGDEDLTKYRKYVFSLIEDQLNRLGLIPKEREDDNNSKLRQGVVGLALYSKDEKTTKALSKLYKNDYEAIHPDLRAAILTAKIRENPEIFDEFLSKYQTSADPNIKDDLLAAITDESGAHEKQLKLLDEHEMVKPQDHLYLFVYLLRNPNTRKETMKWLYDNWESVVKMTGEKSVEDYPRLLASNIRTVKESKAFEEFFTPLASNPILSRTIAVAKADIDARLRLISMDSDDVHAHLASI